MHAHIHTPTHTNPRDDAQAESYRTRNLPTRRYSVEQHREGRKELSIWIHEIENGSVQCDGSRRVRRDCSKVITQTIKCLVYFIHCLLEPHNFIMMKVPIKFHYKMHELLPKSVKESYQSLNSGKIPHLTLNYRRKVEIVSSRAYFRLRSTKNQITIPS